MRYESIETTNDGYIHIPTEKYRRLAGRYRGRR
jgi:hypothetical protein